MPAEDNSEIAELVLSLGREKDYAAVGDHLAGLNNSVIYSLAENDLENGNSSTALTMVMFRGGSALLEKGSTERGQTILGSLVSACVGCICDEGAGQEDGKKWAAVSDKLLDVLPQLSPRSIIDVAFRILAELKARGSLPAALTNFLPMLLDMLGLVGTVEIVSRGESGLGAATGGSSDGSSVTRTGAELKAYWIESACSYRWDPRCSVAVCALLREIVLSERLVETVANRMLRQLRDVELTELPAMVYQLLLFARNGYKQEIIGGIFSVFDAFEVEGGQELADIEGTVMLHIAYSIKQDLDLGSAVVAYAKEMNSMSRSLSTFSFACLLSLARIHRFEETITGFLRTTVIKSIHDSLVLSTTPWIRPYLPAVVLDAQSLFETVVARTSYGWDQVTQSFIHLCLGLVESAASKRSSYSAQACSRVHSICVNSLQSAFKMHEFVRSEIISQILHRVAFQNDSYTVCLELLGNLVEDDPDAVGKYWSKIMDVFDSISVLDAQTVECLIKAVLSILVDETPFRNSLLLVIRKILFAHSIEDRHKALAALFAMIAGISEALQEYGAGRQADLLSSVLLEMIGLLRRCFTQQAEVKVRAYEGLSALLERDSVRTNSMLLNALHSIFRVEFSKYYEGNTGYDSPINIQKCLNPSTHKAAMPIGSFLQCYAKLTSAQAIILAQNNAGSSRSVGVANESCDQLRDLCVRFTKAEMEDFELDPTGDYSINSPSALRNHNTIRLVIGCLDACFEHAAMHSMRGSCSCAIDDPDIALQLFVKYSRFADTLCTRCLDDKNKRIITHSAELSLVSIESATSLLQLILPDRQRQDDDRHPMNAANGHDWFVERTGRAIVWSASQQLIRHLLETCLLRIAGAKVEQVLELAYTVHSGVIMYISDGSDNKPAYLKPKQAKGRTTLLLSCEVLAACANTLKDRSQLGKLAFAIFNPSAAGFVQHSMPSRSQMTEATAELIENLQRSASTLLGQRPIAIKDAVVLIGVIQSLNEWMVTEIAGLDESDQHHVYSALHSLARWTVSLLASELPSDLGLLKALLSLLTTVQVHLQPADAALAQYSVDDLPPAANNQTDAAELCEVSQFVDRMGMAFQVLEGEGVDDEAMDQDDLELFLPRTFTPLMTLLTAWIRSELHTINWATGQLSRCVRTEADGKEDPEVERSIHAERRICLRILALAGIILVFFERLLANTSDLAVRTFLDLLRALDQLTRAKLSIPILPITESYIDILEFVCSDLTVRFYDTVVLRYGKDSNAQQHEEISKDKSKKKNGKGKAKAKSRVQRDSALVSNVVYQIEMTEKHVNQLGAKFKTPLAHYLKRSTARDFRIHRNALPAMQPPAMYGEEDGDSGGLEEEEEVVVSEDSEAETEEMGAMDSVDDDDDDTGGHQAKRMRR